MTYTKINKILLETFISLLALCSCTDEWDDHYNETNQSNVSLWEAISSNSDLSHFAKVIKACGYNEALGSSQVFTVFAPTDENFTESEADSIITIYQTQKNKNIKDADNQAIKEFLQNQIARYNYSIASKGKDSIIMMNGKYEVLTPTTFGGQGINQSNLLEKNGILFTLNNKIRYSPNIYEYLRSDKDLDSVSTFFHDFNKYEFDAGRSVPGDIVNGQTTYLDSVTYLKNILFDYVGELNSEDSTYWMVAPTNAVWDKLITEYKPYFNYDNTVNKRDSLQNLYSKLAIIRGTVFSRTQNTDKAIQDSALSTSAISYLNRKMIYGSYDLKYYQFEHPFASGGVFNGTKDYQCSNGIVKKSSNWNIDKNQTFLQKITAEAENRNNQKEIDELKTKDLVTVTVDIKNPFHNKVSNNKFVDIIPISSSANTSATFSIPNILSNTGYDIYIVTLPALAEDTLATSEERLPTKLDAVLGYNDQTGNPQTMKLVEKMPTTADVIDTLKVGDDIKIPTCSYNLNIRQVTIQIASHVLNSELKRGNYNRIIRLDCIIFKPHETSL
ncbi:MAG TPA: beta-Ig-H3/fasciclin [Prevotella sp.]|nr:beta-Ig-H3/fasciclin [Prevotella sp.]